MHRSGRITRGGLLVLLFLMTSRSVMERHKITLNALGGPLVRQNGMSSSVMAVAGSPGAPAADPRSPVEVA